MSGESSGAASKRREGWKTLIDGLFPVAEDWNNILGSSNVDLEAKKEEFATILAKTAFTPDELISTVDENLWFTAFVDVDKDKLLPDLIKIHIVSQLKKRKQGSLQLLPPPQENVALKLNAYFNGYPTLAAFMRNFSGLKLPQVRRSANFNKQSRYLRADLPSAVGNVNKLDLRLLRGNLDDPEGELEAVKSTRTALDKQDDGAFADVHVFLAGHAMGKTKGVFDLAVQRYTVLIDASGDRHGQQDIVDLHAGLSTIIGKKATYGSQDTFEKAVSKQFMATFAARLIVLQLYLAMYGTQEFSPVNWRDVQLNGLSSTYYGETLSPVRNYFLQLDHDALLGVLRGVLEFHHKKIGRRIVGAFDEANIWIERFPLFRSPNDPLGPANRPVWYNIGSTFANFASLAMLIAGTRIRLRDRRILDSSTGKVGEEAGRMLIIHAGDEFRGCDKLDVLRLCLRLFSSDFTLEMRTKLANKLCGNYKTRPRFVTSYAYELEQAGNAADPMWVLNTFLDKLTNDKEDWAIGWQIKKLIKQHATIADAHNELRRLLCAFLTRNGVIIEPDEDKIDWVAGGICLVEGAPSSPYYRLAETLVAQAIDRYLYAHHVSLVQPLLRTLLETKPDPAYSGAIFDELISVALRDAAKNGRQPSFLRHIPWAGSWTWAGDKQISIRGSLIDFLKQDGEILLPEKKVRIDVIASQLPGIQMFTCNKVTFQLTRAQSRKSVDARDIRKNHRCSELQNIFTQDAADESLVEDTQYTTMRCQVFKWYFDQIQQHKLHGIIRLHFCLPYAPKHSNRGKHHDFCPGTIRLQTRRILLIDPTSQQPLELKIPEASIDVDSSCLELLNIFKEDDMLLLSQAFPLKKGTVKKQQWDVKEVESTITMPVGMPENKRPRSEQLQTGVVPSVLMGQCDSCLDYTLDLTPQVHVIKVDGKDIIDIEGYFCPECLRHKVPRLG
jgi:hypothetical protein